MSDAAPKTGDIRVRSNGTPMGTIPEVFDGSSWLTLRGVVSVDFHVDAKTLPLLTLAIYPAEMEFYTPVERVMLRWFDDEISRRGEKRPGDWP